MKIAMFGGSFDPVHNNHIALCKLMKYKFKLDKIVVVPAYCSPFKSDSQTDSIHRLNMCRLAFGDVCSVEVSDFEIVKKGKSFTIDTLIYLSGLYKMDELFLITGSDAFLTLPDWHQSEKIFKLAHILTVARGIDTEEKIFSAAAEYMRNGARVSVLTEPVGNLSSTALRKALRLKETKFISSSLPADVFKYIKENGLYGYAN